MTEARDEELRHEQDQPGTLPMSLGDEVPPGTEGAGENVCRDCGGTGRRDDTECVTCGGTGVVTQAIGGA